MNTTINGIGNGARPGKLPPGRMTLGNPSLLKRSSQLAPHEAAAFILPIRSFLAGTSAEISLANALQAERNAILAIGKKTDLERPQACRRRNIEKLEDPSMQVDYVDFLLAIGRLYFNAGQYADAETTLSPILEVPAEQGNWHVLSEMGLILGMQGKLSKALDLFDRAEKALETYRFIVTEEDRWEAAVWKARFQAEQEKDLKPLTDTVMNPPDQTENVLAFAHRQRDWAMAVSLTRPESLPAVTPLLVKALPGEVEEAFPFTPVGTFPPRLSSFLRQAAETQDIKAEEVGSSLASIDESLKLKAMLIYLYYRTGYLARTEGRPGEQAGRRLIKQAAGLVAINGKVETELRRHITANLEIQDLFAAGDKIAAELSAFRDGSCADPEKALKKIRTEFKKISDASAESEIQALKEAVVEEAISTVRALMEKPSTRSTAIILADGLFSLDETLAQCIIGVFGQALEEKKDSLSMIEEIKGSIEKTAEEVAAGKYGRKISLSRPEGLFAEPGFRPLERNHNFLFVRLRALPSVLALYRQVYGLPYSHPVNLRSFWFERLAAHAKNNLQKIDLLQKAVKEDGNNLNARVELSCTLWKAGNLNECEKTCQGILASDADPLVRLLIHSVQIVRVISQLNGLPRSAETPSRQMRELVKEAEALFSSAEQAFTPPDGTEQLTSLAQNEWLVILQNMGVILSLNHDLESARIYYDRLLKRDPSNVGAATARCTDLLKQGKPLAMMNLLVKVMSAEKGIRSLAFLEDPNKKIASTPPVYYYLMAEAQLQLGEYHTAEKAIDTWLKLRPGSVEASLMKARIYVFQKRFGDAQKALAEVEPLTRDREAMLEAVGAQACDPTLRRFQGVATFIKAEIYLGNKDKTTAINQYREAAALFSRDFGSEYYEIEMRDILIRALVKASIDEPDDQKSNAHMLEALQEAATLSQKYPFSVNAHECMLLPLLVLDKFQEALTEMHWIAENAEAVSSVDMANILTMATRKSGHLEEVKRIILTLKQRLGDDYIRSSLKSGATQAKGNLPELGSEIDQTFAAICSVF